MSQKYAFVDKTKEQWTASKKALSEKCSDVQASIGSTTGEGKLCAYPPRAQDSPESKVCQESWLGINTGNHSSVFLLGVQEN